MTIAYVYKWTHIPTLRWYVGSRTATGCHPDDGYISHSKDVTPMVLENPENWKREIVDTGQPQEMYDLETTILRTLDAKHDPRSFNKHNNDGVFVRWGDKHPNKNPINAKRIGDSLRGVPKSEAAVIKMSDSLKALGENHPSKREDVRESKRRKMISKGEDHHQKTKSSRESASNRVVGDKNPMFGKQPHNKITKINTPLGQFESVSSAAIAHGKSERTILRWVSSDQEKYKEYYK